MKSSHFGIERENSTYNAIQFNKMF